MEGKQIKKKENQAAGLTQPQQQPNRSPPTGPTNLADTDLHRRHPPPA
jgi:hypothetical protein